jgi:ubiquinone/menaquinone biosynthesis C-methylase UbiE
MTMADDTPSYDDYQSSFHEAFRPELDRVVDDLPLPHRGAVLDVPCGGGFYTRRLAERLGAGACLTAVDACDAYLDQTRDLLRRTPSLAAVRVQKADAYHLPDADATFDLVWCAQSLISLDPVRAVREFRRVTKPDGWLAVLEVDEYHHVLLSWSAELEARLPLATHAASVKRYGDAVKLAPARRLRRILKQSAFQLVRRDTYPIERVAPFDPATRAFLTHHFAHLRSLVRPQLPGDLRHLFDALTDPDAEESLFNLPDSELICINALYLARPSAG